MIATQNMTRPMMVLELEPASMKEGLWCFLVCSDGPMFRW